MSDQEPNYTPNEPYTPGPDPSQLSSQQPPLEQQPAQQPPQQQPEINDPPIEHDPWGQALVSLPFAAASAIGSAAAEGGSLLESFGEEAVSWVGSELGIAAGEAATEPDPSSGGDQGTGGDTGAGGGSSAGGDPGSGDGSESMDPNMSYDQGAEDYSSNEGS